jgi:DNA-binding transcriptional ArsR family regulator
VNRNRRSRLTKRGAYIAGVTLEPDDVLRALVEPHRRAILRLVARTELAAGEIAAAFDVTRPAISQHLTVLRTVGLLHERREGARRLYRTRPEGLDGLRALLDDLGQQATPGQPGASAPPRQRSG